MSEERISLFPEMTEEQHKAFNQAVEDKQHAEYLCYMMLNELAQGLPLLELVKLGIKKGIVGAEVLEEFWGVTLDGKQSDEPGCCSAENYTLPSLLRHWKETTDKMMKTIVSAAREQD